MLKESIYLPYGNRKIGIDLKKLKCRVIEPENRSVRENQKQIIANCLSGPKFDDMGSLSGKSIGVAINDPTRPVPHSILLSLLIEYLLDNNAVPENIQFYIATGTHLPPSNKEICEYLPEFVWKNYKIYSHNCDIVENLAYLGETKAGTPVYVNKMYYQSDIKIVVGNIEPHHFMGHSGGVKTAAIGLAGRETIQVNHSMLIHPGARMGLYKSNPMRMDVEDIGRMIGVDFALNTVVNSEKEIIDCFWSDPVRVMKQGIQSVQDEMQLSNGGLANEFDIVIASAGGYPKDINLYQAQKAITNACFFAKEGAPIILIAECSQGVGSSGFERFVRERSSFNEVIEDFCENDFEIGPHKAYLLAKQGIDHPIYLFSNMPGDDVRRFFLHPVENLEKTIAELVNKSMGMPDICVLPYATHTMPKILDA